MPSMKGVPLSLEVNMHTKKKKIDQTPGACVHAPNLSEASGSLIRNQIQKA